MMYGIWKRACGLEFMGIIANTKEECEEYLQKTYGDEKEHTVYNKDAFVIKEVKVITED
jgi:hypothetical protein